MPAVGIPPHEAARVAHDELALVGVHPRPIGIGDAAVDRARRALAAQRQLGGRRGVDDPGMMQVQIEVFGRQHFGIRQAGGLVGGCMARDMPGGLDGLAQGRLGEVGGRGRAPALAGVHRQVQRAVAGLLDRFDIVFAYRHRQTQTFGDFGNRIAGADLARIAQNLFDEFGKTRVIRRDRQGGRGSDHCCPMCRDGYHSQVRLLAVSHELSRFRKYRRRRRLR